MSYYNGKKVLTVVRNTMGVLEGVYYTDNILNIDNNLPTQTIKITGDDLNTNITGESLSVVVNGANNNFTINGDYNHILVNGEDTVIDLSNCISSIEIVDNNPSAHGYIVDNLRAENIAKGVTILGVTGTHENGITGVTYEDSELTVDCEALQPHEIYIERAGKSPSININGDTTTVYLALVDGTVNISDCTSDIYIEDNNPQQHTVSANNLAPRNIAKGVTILGVTGTHESGTPIEVATATEMDALLVADNVNKIYKYVGTTNATYEYGELYQVIEE